MESCPIWAPNLKDPCVRVAPTVEYNFITDIGPHACP